MPDFVLHRQLAADCHPVGELDLSSVLLLDDSRYPWVILVPRIAGVREIFELGPSDRAALLDESCRLGAWMMQAFGGDKLNVGALGNLVPQLHVHHVVRRKGDPAWPGPVWGHSQAMPYDEIALTERIDRLRRGLGLSDR